MFGEKFLRSLGIATALIGLFSIEAGAVPSFSDQTGEPCSACHVGSFGPQLTARGRLFKLSGYSEGTASRQLPLLSGMAEESFTHTTKGQQGEAAPGFHQNDNVATDQVSLFVAGRIYDHLGVFNQTTWDGIHHKTTWDNTDLRYGRDVSLAGVDTTLGLTLNNNPTVTDPYNTTPAWGFPYASSKLAPTPGASPLIQGALAQRVVGSTAYAMIDDKIYAEGGLYRTLPGLKSQKRFGIQPTDGPTLSSAAPYWRLAYQNESPKTSWHVGTFGMQASTNPSNDGSQGTDKFLDNGLDAAFQWHASKAHVFSAYGSAIHEDQRLLGSYNAGNASDTRQALNSYRVTGSYNYDQTYGFTVGGFKSTGSHDATLYAASDTSGYNKNRPDSAGYVLQLDYTPFGKEGSWMSPWANLRFALQYTGYTEFNGGSAGYDGNSRKASDNNTLYFLTWIAF